MNTKRSPNNKPTRPLIPLFKVFMAPSVIASLKKTLLSGYIGQGSKVEEFERVISKFLGNPYIATVNSGTSALHLALRLSDVKAGDEVISTPMTCTATNWPILERGADIAWADIDPNTGNVTPESIKMRITKKTKAIMVVDWGGYPCDIDGIRKIAPGIPIIEDAAHAFGSEYKTKKVGSAADYTCFSFQAIKHLTTGDGGLLALRNKKTHERAKLLRWYGIDRETRSQHERIEVDICEWGYKFHMNDINATIGLANFKHTRKILKKHRENAAYYKKHLQGLSRVTLLSEQSDYLSSYWLFTIKVHSQKDFLAFMTKKGIMVSQVHRRNDTHPTVAEFRRKLPGIDAFSTSMMCIPVGWWVDAKTRAYIVRSIIEYDKS